MATTIKDVAALAGVSPSTVSRVCNDHPSISPETRERVRSAMAQLNYEPNTPAPTADQRLRMISVLLPPSPKETYENSFYLQVIRGISQVCNQRQVACTVITGRDAAEMLQAVQSLSHSRQMDGFILLYSMKGDPVVEYLCEQGLLYVLIGKDEQSTGQTICIDNDNLLAGREATEYLYQLGHRRIGYLGIEGAYVYSSERRSGYQLALVQHGLPLRPDYCIEMKSPNLDDAAALKELLLSPERPTALVVSDDILAVGLERTCSAMSLRIPEDISIVSFNNSLLAQLNYPQLTSVEVNSFQLGFEAANQILNHADNPDLMAAKIIVPHRIIPRASCRAVEE